MQGLNKKHPGWSRDAGCFKQLCGNYLKLAKTMEFLFPQRGIARLFPAVCPTHYKGWIMKLTCLLVAMGCTGLQLLMANTGNSQELSDVRVSLELRNEPLRTAFTKIEQQTDFRFAYSRQQVDNYRSITLSRGNYTVEKALELLLTNTRLLFRTVNNKIIIYRADDPAGGRTAGELQALAEAQDGGTLKGKITNDKNEPVVGASILLSGVDKGTSAGLNGEYTLTGVKAGKYSLQVSAIGYQNIIRDVTISDGQVQELNFTLKAGSNAMNEVIVTGYSRQSKRDVTGAASTVSAETIAQTPVTDITTALQGRVAGVSVDDQGGPGNSGTIRIRGVGSLGNNDPLYVIDGVQVRIGPSNGTNGGGGTNTGSQDIANLLNPSDIETLTVLKDPSLTALYGSEGSNGVIVITTKSGKRGDPKLEYSTYVADQFPLKFPKMVTPQQQADALYNSYTNTGTSFPYGSFYGTGTSPVLPDYIIEGSSSNLGVAAGDPAANPSLYDLNSYRILKANKGGTNWWKTLFKPALSQNHQLSLSGATDKSNFAVTFGYLDDNGTMLNSFFRRYSLRVNTDFKIKPWLRIGENVEFSYASGNSIGGRQFNNDIASIYSLSPLLPTHDIAGNIAGTNGAPLLGGSNPLIDRTTAGISKNSTESAIGSAYIEAEPIKGLTYQSKIGVQFVPSQYHDFNDSFPQQAIPSHTTYYYEGNSYYTDWRWLNKIAYSTTLNNIHKITAFVAYEARQIETRNSAIVETNLIGNQPNFQYVSAGTFNPNFPPSGSGSIQKNTSEFGNVTYSLMDRYLFTGTLRHDGSSIFGLNRQEGTFPAVSAGWRVSQEHFMDNVKWISDLKLRGSWGKSGNDAIPPGKQFSLINSTDQIYGGYDITGSNTSQIVGAYLSQLGNENVHWETNVTTNLGFDAAFINGRLTAGLNWFNRKTSGLLYEPPYSGTAGAPSAPYENVMSFTNKGLELEMGFQGGNKTFRYEMNFNISGYRSKVDYIDGDSSAHIDLATYSPTHYNLTRNQVGHPVSEFYGYEQAGIFQSGADYTAYGVTQPGLSASNAAGHFKFRDLTGPNGGKPDGNLGAEDQTWLGNPNPKFSYGYNLNLYYKAFDLGIFFQGVYGNKIFNYWRAYSEWPGMLGAGSLNTWTPSHTNAKLPMYTEDNINASYDNVPSSFFVESGSYLRIKSLQLGYTIPRNKTFSRLRFYVQAFNVFTFTHYKGMDPEVNSGDPGSLGIDYGTQYPLSRKVLFGVNLSL
jgi:TonB-dependent starch-binding outer membrane protein SusC